MIRITSLSFNANGKVPLMLQLGWYDPNLEMLRTKMTEMALETLRDFQTRMNLVKGTFNVEAICEFCIKREKLGSNLVRVVIFDAATGMGVEWNKPAPQAFAVGEVSVVKNYREMTDEYLRFLENQSTDPDEIAAIQAELERRRV